MAIASLSVDFVANMAKFSGDMGKLTQLAERNSKNMEDAFKRAGNAFKTIAAGYGASQVWRAFVVDVATAGKEIDKFASLSGATTDEFQRWTAGAKDVGIQGEKLADIFKDVNEKFGEFASTGKGELTDFFENIAPKVGITAAAFRDLSGPQALQLYYTSLEKANVGHQEMTKYMEAVANDATLLAPLLANNGQRMGELADQADKLGSIMSKELIAQSKEFDAKMRDLDTSVNALKLSLGQSLIPAINDVVQAMRDAWPVVADFGKFLGESLGRAVAGPDSPIGQVDAQIAPLKSRLADLNAEMNKSRLLRINPFASDAEIAREALNIRLELEKLEKLKANLSDISPGLAKPATTQQAAASPFGAAYTPPSRAGRSKSRAASAPRAFEDYDAKIMQAVAGAISDNDVTRAKDLAAQIEKLDSLYFDAGLSTDIYDAAMKKLTGSTASFSDAQQRLDDMLGNTSSANIEKQRADMLLLADAFERGKITVEQYTEAAMARLGTDLPATLERATDAMSVFAEQAGRNIQDSLADFLFDPFDQGLEGMLQNFGKTLQRMAADAAAAQILNSITGWGKSNSGAGGFTGAIAGILGAFGGARADGGPVTGGVPYLVGERGPELFMPANSGNIVPNKSLKGMSGGSTVINVTVQGGSAPDVRRAAGQGAREALAIMNNSQRYA